MGEINQAKELIEAVRLFIAEHISCYGPDVKPSEAFDIVAQALSNSDLVGAMDFGPDSPKVFLIPSSKAKPSQGDEK